MKLLTTTLTALALGISAALAGGDGWMTDLDAALEKSRAENKPVLIEFTGSDWCPPCMMMSEKVFSKEDFIEEASKKFILVELDFPKGDRELAEKNQPHAQKYKVTGFPTIVLLDEDQEEFGRFIASRYPSVEEFLAKLDKSLSRRDLE